MKRLSALIFIVVLCLALNVFYGQPQTAENLLTNPGFEGEFVEQDGEAPQNVATGWNAWHIPRSDSSPAYANHAPFYNEETVRTRGDEPGKAQVYFNQYATHQGGVYQQVENLTVGANYRFSIYAWVWSSIGQDWDISEQPGNVSVRVGIDPSGGTDGASEDIVWSTTAVFLYNAYYQYSVIAAAESATITVFVESTVGEPVANNYVYLEDAVLEPATQNVVVVDSTPTSETNEDLAGEDEATPTLAPTSTATAAQDATATDQPTATEIPPTATLVPTDTAEPTATEGAAAIDDPGDASISDQYPETAIHTVVEDDTLSAIALQYGSSEEAIKDANELTSSLIVVGQQLIVPINLPDPTETPLPPDLPTATETPIPPTETPTPTATPIPTATPVVYIVQTGDTLLDIAVAYSITVEALLQLNGIQNPDQLAVGLVLLIPTPDPTPLPTATPQIQLTALAESTITSYTTYTVQIGDTLDQIATQFNTTIDAIVRLNGITNPSRIFPGQVLQIPAAPGEGTPTGEQTATATSAPSPTPIPTSAPTTYTVQAGDTLFQIAQRFGVSVVELGTFNNIVDYNTVFPGQVLTIPG